MFKEALQEYARIVRGNSVFTSIVFHVITGIAVGLVLFVIVNVGGEIPLMGFKDVKIYYNENYIFLIEAKKYFNLSSISAQGKALELIGCVIFSILTTTAIAYARRKASLDDALSAIRKRLIGYWDLRFDDFAAERGNSRSFTCRVEFLETEARKLRARFYESSELSVTGTTPLVALYVAEGADKPDYIQISFPVDADARANDQPESFLYWVKLEYLASAAGKSLRFEGTWYHITPEGKEFRMSGAAILAPTQKPQTPV